MEFIETDVFTKQIQRILSDEEYSFLQMELIQKPDVGQLIPAAKGLRKLRWSIEGKGKRGGIRIIYYWDIPAEQIYVAYVYKKSKQEDLTFDQLKRLVQHVKKGVL